ncbi:hypothetical protein L1887_39332 [Cichorium endivia]|nr:hypothetical protein L1887_39332 [Cichorium endivia]
MDTTLLIAGCIAYNSLLCLFRFPGGLANIGKIDGIWLFIHADLTALYISMAVLLVGTTVGPTFWRKIKEHVKKALGIAIVAMAIAVHQIVLIVIGDDFWLRLFVNGVGVLSMGFICVSIFIVWVW